MKTSILTLLAAAGFTAAAFAAPVADATPEGEAKIISYNIRLGVADDGANSWEHRREATLRMLEREAAPPPQMTGTFTAFVTASINSRSIPCCNPSLSTLVSRISPAPSATPRLAHSTTS